MSEVDRQLQKVTNTVIKQVDTIAMSAIGTAITQEVNAVVIWTTVGTAKPLTDILLGIQFIEDLNQGYHADTLVVSPTAYTYLMVNDAVQQMRKREASENPVYSGQIETIAGLRIVKTPNLPVNTRAWVLDSTQLGGMADEIDGAPGYSTTELNVEIQPIRSRAPATRSLEWCDERPSSASSHCLRDREDHRPDYR